MRTVTEQKLMFPGREERCSGPFATATFDACIDSQLAECFAPIIASPGPRLPLAAKGSCLRGTCARTASVIARAEPTAGIVPAVKSVTSELEH